MSLVITTTATSSNNQLVYVSGDYSTPQSNVVDYAAWLEPGAELTVTGRYYTDIPLPTLPQNLNSIILKSIIVNGNFTTQYPQFVLMPGYPAITIQVYKNNTSKGDSQHLSQTPTISLEDINLSLGSWSQSEILNDQLRIYFDLSCYFNNTSTEDKQILSHLYISSITATWEYSYPINIVGDPIFIGGI